jgi:hypothetical protein
MRIRAYEEGDLEALKRIHAAQGFAYPFPDLGNPLFLTKLVVIEQDENGETVGRARSSQAASRGHEAEPFACAQGEQCCAATSEQGIVGAALLRLTAEAYLLLDPKAGTPRQRWEWLLHLHAATEHEAARRGLEDVHAWLPPPIAGKFGKRLTRLGWLRDDAWTPFCRRLDDHQ